MLVAPKIINGVSQSVLRNQGLKRCCACRLVRPLAHYDVARTTTSLDKLKSECRPCAKKRIDKWRGDNKARILEYNKDRARSKRAESDPRYMVVCKLWSSKNLAETRGYKACSATADELELIFTTKCQICGKECGNSICLDHCHKTGRFRGFICNWCNSILGYAKDDVSTLRKVVKYLTDGVSV